MTTIAVLSALHKESVPLFEIPGSAPTRVYGFDLAEREIGNAHVVVVTSGMGTINAAAAAQYLICRHQLDALLLSGIAGSLNPLVGVGDVIVGQRLECLEANMDVIAEDFPHLASFGSDARLVRLAQDELAQRGFARQPSVDQLLAAHDDLSLFSPNDATTLANAAPFGQTDPHEPRYVVGAIATSDLFHEEPGELRELRRAYRVDCEEMEGAAVAQVCARAGVPFLALRAISNPCGMTYGELDGRTQDLVDAARIAASLTLGIIERHS